MTRVWRRHDTQPLGDFKVFSLRRDELESPRTGGRHDFYVLEAPPWVNVVPITEDGQMVLVEQYRHGIGDVTLEIPGGIVDGEETPLETAERELLEETGYRAASVSLLGVGHPNPAILNNRFYSYLAAGARKVAEPTPDGSEDISIVTVPVADIPGLIRGGRITHALVLAAFYYLSLTEGRSLIGPPVRGGEVR